MINNVLRLISLPFFLCSSNLSLANDLDANQSVCEYVAASSHLPESKKLTEQCSQYGRLVFLYIPSSECGAIDQSLECLQELTNLKNLFIQNKVKTITPAALASISDELMTVQSGGQKLCRAQQELYMSASMWNASVAGELYHTCISELQDLLINVLETADWVAN